jgi:hypothetical protein
MRTDADKKWRIDNVSHLKGLRLQFRRYSRWSESWDHDHCAACWVKLAESEGPDVQHEGYATCEDYPKGACYEWVPDLFCRFERRYAVDDRRSVIASITCYTVAHVGSL